MRVITFVYSIFLIAFSLLATLAMLASPHGLGNMETILILTTFSSLIIFPLTVYFLYRSFFSQRNNSLATKSITLSLLVLTVTIFSYFTYDIVKYKLENESWVWFDYIPIIGVALTVIIFIGRVLFNRA